MKRNDYVLKKVVFCLILLPPSSNINRLLNLIFWTRMDPSAFVIDFLCHGFAVAIQLGLIVLAYKFYLFPSVNNYQLRLGHNNSTQMYTPPPKNTPFAPCLRNDSIFTF